ncbi:MAG: sigma-54-dependent Fis family transcriptional regulator, partial [Candidatus Riflebacteria bacterium HGW-Riflebacteria-2]
KGAFREDLYYRLSVITLTLPPLRDRPEDILHLADSYLSYFSQINHKIIQGFSEETREVLLGYRWPGNLRELRNAIERAVILSNGSDLEPEDLPMSIFEPPTPQAYAIGDPISLEELEKLHIKKVLSTATSLQNTASILGIDQATLWRKRKQYNL